MWALFAACQGLCQFIGAGIDARGIPPERISFPHALLAATGTIPASTDQMDYALATSLLKSSSPSSPSAAARTGRVFARPRRRAASSPASRANPSRQPSPGASNAT